MRLLDVDVLYYFMVSADMEDGRFDLIWTVLLLFFGVLGLKYR